MSEHRGATKDAEPVPQRRSTASGDSTVAMIESAAWLQLDLADYLRMPRPMSIIDKQERESLRKRISRQLKQQENSGDPLHIAATIRHLMEGTEAGATEQTTAG